MKVSGLIRIVLGITGVFLCLLLLVTFLFGYEKTLTTLINLFHFQSHAVKIRGLFSQRKFMILQGLIFLMILAMGLLVKYYEGISARVHVVFSDFWKSVLKLFTGLPPYWFLVMLLPVAAWIYYAVNLPLTPDEAYTYLKFTSRNLLVSLTYYPAPNNHIFHSLLTNITDLFFPHNMLLSLRLPTIIASILTLLVSLYFVRKHFNDRLALAVTGLFPVFFMGIYYGFTSRGYQLVVLFFVLSLHLAFNIIRYGGRVKYWFWLSLFSVLGFFTMPSYLYAFVLIHAFIFLMSAGKSNLPRQIISFFSTILLSLVLYLPVIIVSGAGALVNNRFVAPIDRGIVFSKLPDLWLRIVRDISGVELYIILPLLAIFFILLLIRREWFYVKLFSLFIAGTCLLLLAHSVIPFTRTFIYFGFFIAFLSVLSMRGVISRMNPGLMLPLILCIQVLFIYNFNSKIYSREHYSIVSRDVSRLIAGHGKSYMVNSTLFESYLLIELKAGGIKNTRVSYYLAKPMNADTVTRADYIIIDHSVDETRNKKAVYATKFYSVYRRQDNEEGAGK